MEDFKQRKNVYLGRLISLPVYLYSLTNSNNSSNAELRELLLDPKNERDLELSTICLSFEEDKSSFAVASNNGGVEIISFEENQWLLHFAKLIKSIENIDDLDDIPIYEGITPECKAKIMFDYFRASFYNTKALFNYIYFICNSNNIFDKQEIRKIITKMNIQELIKPENIKNFTDTDIMNLKLVAEEFHKLCLRAIDNPTNTMH